MDDANQNPAELLAAAALLAKQAETLLAQKASQAAAPSGCAVKFLACDMAGMRHCKGDRPKKGDRLDLVPEPSNPHDPNAVIVLFQGAKAGYVSRESALALAREREKGWQIAGPAFCVSSSGGAWDEGKIQARLHNPVIGWDQYNPAATFASNQAAYEAWLLQNACAPAAGPASKPSPAL